MKLNAQIGQKLNKIIVRGVQIRIGERKCVLCICNRPASTRAHPRNVSMYVCVREFYARWPSIASGAGFGRIMALYVHRFYAFNLISLLVH